jgi:serine-type D-Ala-D-Ala carboxypeptidase/endopeptidase
MRELNCTISSVAVRKLTFGLAIATIFDGYLGQYQLAPNFVLTVTKEGNELFVQATGQPRFQLFPQSDRDYFLKVVDAQITFNTDGQGRATELVLHQNGDHTAKRIQ